MSEFSFFRFRSCGLLSNEEVEHKDEIVRLTEEVLHARGQECDESISKLSVSELRGLVEQVRELGHKKKKKQLIKQEFRFKDRVTAANILAEALKDTVKKQQISNAVILGIPRGGVITADIVARKLSAPEFDIVIPRKLTDPDNKEQAIGAIMEDGTTYLDEQLIRHFQISSEYIEQEKSHQIQEIKRRTSLFRGDAVTNESNLENKIVILVDDGAATGATVIAAARSIRKRFRLKRLIIALPVAPKDTVKLLKQEADTVEVVTSPSSNFRSVGQYYQDFNAVEDDQIREIIRNRGLLS